MSALPGQWAYDNAAPADTWRIDDAGCMCDACMRGFYSDEMHERFPDLCKQCGQQREADEEDLQ